MKFLENKKLIQLINAKFGLEKPTKLFFAVQKLKNRWE